MKTVGIIGGLSPESTQLYYRWLNEGASARLGKHHSLRMLIASVDFGHFVDLKEKDDWRRIGAELAAEAVRLERAGADLIMLATNTMHIVADRIEAAIQVPFLHLADGTGRVIKDAGVKRVGLLGTRYTMEKPYYRDRLAEHGIEAIVPERRDRDRLNSIIYDELCQGQVRPKSRADVMRMMAALEDAGAEGIILGCTEITMLIGVADARAPLFDTTRLHVRHALTEVFADVCVTRQGQFDVG